MNMWNFLAIIFSVIALIKIKNLRRELNEFRTMVLRQGQPVATKEPKTEKPDIVPEKAAQIEKTEQFEDWEEEEEERIIEPGPTQPPVIEEYKNDDRKAENSSGFEFNIGAKLPVWIGAISLACAAFFLVKYSIEQEILGPLGRTITGALFGAALSITGYKIFGNPRIPNADRIAQGLSGAGLIALTFSLYAAVHTYGLIGASTGFAAMVGIIGITVASSLRLGQPVAAFGMVGGLLTPVLFSSGEENFTGLFTYLFLLYGSLLTLTNSKKWHDLSALLLGGIFIWCLIALTRTGLSEHTGSLSLFLTAISAITFFTGWKSENTDEKNGSISGISPHLLGLIAAGGSTILLLCLQGKYSFTGFDWAMSLLLSAGVVALGVFQPEKYRHGVKAKLATDIILLNLYLIDQVTITAASFVTLSLAAIYVLAPAIITRIDRRDISGWAITQSAAAITLFLTGYFNLDTPILADNTTFWGCLAFLYAAYSIYETKTHHQRADKLTTAIHASTATAFVSLGLAIILPDSYIPLACALQIAALLVIHERIELPFLQRIAGALTILFLMLNLQIIWNFFQLTALSLIGKTSSLPYLDNPDMLLPKFLLPAAAMATASFLYTRQEQRNPVMKHALMGSAMSLFLAGAYILLRLAIHGTPIFLMPEASFIEREIITLMIAGCGIAAYRIADKTQATHAALWGHIWIITALARNIYFDLFLHNPLLDNTQNVGAWSLLNGVTLTYGGALGLTIIARQNISKSAFIKALSILFLLVAVTLNVRQLFHGAILENGDMGNSEMYAYSITWLATGAGLLTYGIRKQDRNIRMASLAFLALTIGKVFLIDASELEGLYRIFSFLGLGVSLIGLSMFYTRYISKLDKPEAK